MEGTLEITISNQTAPTGVPDSDDFTLRDICNVIQPPVNSLRNCFITAGATIFASGHVTGFDPAYEGNHDRLSNFRNYQLVSAGLGYGLLYNWYAAAKNGGIGVGSIAPSGWHVPTSIEVNSLLLYIDSNYTNGHSTTAGGHLKRVGTINWDLDSGCDNSTGFSAVGAGVRDDGGNPYPTWWFSGIKKYTGFWTVNGMYFMVYDSINDAYIFDTAQYETAKNYGLSIRLVMDNPNLWYAGMTMTDIDGNVYNTVKIGTQVWMAENLKTEHYKDNVAIPLISDITLWLADTTGALCAYDNDWNNV
jgi:uncharacterized protein (TIGR02145 family)